MTMSSNAFILSDRTMSKHNLEGALNQQFIMVNPCTIQIQIDFALISHTVQCRKVLLSSGTFRPGYEVHQAKTKSDE